MEHTYSVFSLLYFLTFITYIFWGSYVIRLNPKANVNIVFFLLCISLSIWSFGFAMANSARDLQRCLFWRRFSAIGWTSVYSLTLHIILLLAGKRKYVKRKGVLLLLYLPAFINMYVFSFSKNMAAVQYNLVKTDYGWTNISVNNLYDWFFYLYYALFIIASLIIVWNWKRKLDNRKIIKQANFVFIGMLASLILGSFTDLIANTISSNSMPQMASIFVLLPTWGIYYATRHYGLMEHEMAQKDEIVVTHHEKKKIFYNIAMAFYLGGIVTFVAEYKPFMDSNEGNLKAALIKGGLLLAIGFGICIIQMIKRESVKEILTIILLVLSIPIVTLQFLKYSTITIWALPIIIIISSLIFSKRTLLISATIMAVITQRIVWIIKPEVLVRVDKYDYIGRIGLIITAFLIGLYVNRIYVAKIKENNYQIAFQKMNADISYDFVTLNQNNFDQKVNRLLSGIGEFFQVDRTYLFTINHGRSTMTYSNEWCNIDIPPEVGTIEEVPLEVFPWWIDQLKTNGLVYIEDVSNMPKEATAEHEQLMRQGVKSLVSVPIIGEGEIQGFIGIDSVVAIKEWSQENIKLLNIMANLIASGLMQIKADKEIEFMAYYDHLTRLPNRLLFEDRVNQAIHLAKRSAKLVSVIFIDLDNFKSINDTMGHSSGDRLLQKVAQSLVKQLRKTDTVARFGGDEFLIMLNDIKNPKEIAEITERIMGIFLNPFNVNGQEIFVTSSAGVATYPLDGEEGEDLIKNADTSMYKAKSMGKNQYALCTPDMKDEVRSNMMLSNDLYSALENNEFIVYYQPQIDLVTGKITGLEALLRWMHPKQGMISPLKFIPLAEKNNLINRIGDWVLKIASIQNKKWQDMGLGYLRMGINLSVVQFNNPKLAENVESIIKETGLDPKYIELEITESIAIKESNNVNGILQKLKEIGVSIAIDDFGTEYSSLSRLKKLPIDRIKIDMEFIQGLESNEKDQAITMVIISLAKSLGLNVLAEGVETAPQLEFLNQKMCDYVQGYYYYKPMPADEMEKVLRNTLMIKQ